MARNQKKQPKQQGPWQGKLHKATNAYHMMPLLGCANIQSKIATVSPVSRIYSLNSNIHSNEATQDRMCVCVRVVLMQNLQRYASQKPLWLFWLGDDLFEYGLEVWHPWILWRWCMLDDIWKSCGSSRTWWLSRVSKVQSNSSTAWATVTLLQVRKSWSYTKMFLMPSASAMYSRIGQT